MQHLKVFLGALIIVVVSGCTTVQSASAIRDLPNRTIPGSVDTVYSEVISTLMSLGWQVTSANKAEHIIQARTPATIWTMGDLVTVYAVQATPSTVRVDVTSASAQQYDWGKNKENIEKFYNHLLEAVNARK